MDLMFQIASSLCEFYISVDEIFVEIRNCLSKERSEFFEFPKMSRIQIWKWHMEDSEDFYYFLSKK